MTNSVNNKPDDRTTIVVNGLKAYYPWLVKPRAFKDNETPAYKVTVAIPKDDEATLKPVRDAIAKVAAGRQFSETFLENRWSDGDMRDLTKYPHCKGNLVFTPKNSKEKVPVYDAEKNRMTDEQIQANLNNGAVINVHLNVWWMDVNNMRRVNCDLLAVQLITPAVYIKPEPVERDYSNAFGVVKGAAPMVQAGAAANTGPDETHVSQDQQNGQKTEPDLDDDIPF